MESKATVMDKQGMQRIADHDRLSTWRGPLPRPTHAGYARNPLCGDEIWVELVVEDDVIQQARFHGQGCVISQACASMLCEGVAEKQLDYLSTASCEELMDFEIGQLTLNRQRCARLAYEALRKALAPDPLRTKVRS